MNDRLDVHAVILAAGKSSRMGGANKLLAEFAGEPLVRLVAERALASKACGVTLVTGHQADRILDAVKGLSLDLAHNPDFETGMASSLKVGVAAVPAEAAGVLVILADMPDISAGDLDRLITAFRKAEGRAIIRAVHEGTPGNPVILPRHLFKAVAGLSGDTGARSLIDCGLAELIEVELGDAALRDADTPDAMHRAGGQLKD